MPVFFIYLLKVNIALIVFYLLYHFLLRRLTFYALNRWFLLGLIVIASTFPFINSEKIFANFKSNNGNNIILAYSPNWNQIKVLLSNAEPNFTIWILLYIVYWLGVIAMVILFFGQIFSLLNVHINATKNKHAIWTTVLDIQPLSFFKNIYINPAKHTLQELQTIIQHEKVHTSQWHTIDLLLAEVNKIVYWFNPGVWLLKNAIRENLEFIADKKVLESGKDAMQYQYELLHVITGSNKATAIASQFSLLHLKNRIMMMNKQKSSKWSKAKYLMLIPILCVVAVVVAQKNNKGVVGQNKIESQTTSFTEQTNVAQKKTSHSVSLTGAVDDYYVDVKTIDGNRFAIAYDKNWKEVSRIKLGGTNSKEVKKWEEKYGEIPTSSTSISNTITKETVSVQNVNENEAAVVSRKTTDNVSTANIEFKQNDAVVKLSGNTNFKLSNKNGEQPLYVIDGKITSATALENFNPEQIQEIEILKDKPAIEKYGEAGKKGVVIIKTKKTNAISFKNPEITLTGKEEQPLYIVDDVISTKEAVDHINPNDIKSVDVLKDNSATALYGDKGKHGVIKIKTKNFKEENSIPAVTKASEKIGG